MITAAAALVAIPLSASPLFAGKSAVQKGSFDWKPSQFESMFHWRSIGPVNMGGRVSAIAYAPGSSRTYYVTYGTGGIFKTLDRGTTFTPIFEHEGTSSVGSIQVCRGPGRTDNKDEIVWVGSGEGNGRNSSSYGDGVYLSKNSGRTWTNVGLKDSRAIPSLAADPNNPAVCYVAAVGHLWGPNEMRGVYKTDDMGKTWKRVLFVDDKTGACAVVLDPKNPNTVYAAMYSRVRHAWGFYDQSTTGGIFKSTDAGAHWTKLTSGLPTVTGRIGLAISQQNPNVLEAVVGSNEGGNFGALEDNVSLHGGVFRTEDGGGHWTRVNHQDPRPFYFSKIYLDPKNDQRVFMIGWSIWRSDDGGKTFVAGIADDLHPDWHGFAFDPNDADHLLAGCDGGLFQTENLGKTWESLNIMAVGEFYTVAVDNSDPYRVSGGLQDNGCWLGVSDSRNRGIGTADWVSMGGGDGFYTGFDSSNPNIVYSESQGGSISRLDLRGRYKGIQPVPSEGSQNYRFNWNTPFFVSKFDPTVLYMGANVVFKLTKRGDEYKVISPDLTTHDGSKNNATGSAAETYCSIVTMAESPVKQGELWTGSDDGLIYVTTDDGGSWTNVTPPQVKGHYVSWVAASSADPNRAYAVVDGHRSDIYTPLVLETNDLGRHWTDITSNLPQTDVTRCITEDPHNPKVLFVGTETGAWFTMNNGASWMSMGRGLPTCSVQDLVIQPQTGDIVAATHGRSVWICDDLTDLGQLTEKVAREPLHVFDPKPASAGGFGRSHGEEGDHFFQGQNPRRGAKIDYWIGKDAGPVSIVIKDANGHDVATLDGPGGEGLHRVYWNLRPSPAGLPNQGTPGGMDGLAAGTYTVIVTAGNASQTVKLEYVKADWQKDGSPDLVTGDRDEGH